MARLAPNASVLKRKIMWIEIAEQLRDEIEILAKETGVRAAELVGSLVKSDFEELVDFAET